MIQASLNKNKIHLRPVGIGLMQILFFFLVGMLMVTVILFQNETGWIDWELKQAIGKVMSGGGGWDVYSVYFLVVEGEESFGLVIEVEEVCFFLVAEGFVPVAGVVFFLLVAGVLVAGVGKAAVFVFLVWGVGFESFFLALLLCNPAVSPF